MEAGYHHHQGTGARRRGLMSFQHQTADTGDKIMAKAIELVETRSGCAIMEREPRYDVLLHGKKIGQLYFNMRGYVGTSPLRAGPHSTSANGASVPTARPSPNLTRNGPRPKGTSPASDLLMS